MRLPLLRPSPPPGAAQGREGGRWIKKSHACSQSERSEGKKLRRKGGEREEGMEQIGDAEEEDVVTNLVFFSLY